MLFDILKYVYIGITVLLLAFILIEMFTTKNWRKQINAALVIAPLVLRILLIR